MDKLKMMSVDKVQDNIQKIRELFPNAVTEVKRGEEVMLAVDFDVLKQELANTLIDEREYRYQFTWPDKQRAILDANTPIDKTLRPVKNDETTPTSKDSNGNPYCSTGSVDFDNTQNLYIEGDNLAVLKLLQETYLGKIKMIYIDPPYNTGNDFVYNDNFSQDSDEYVENSGQYDEQGNRLVQNTESNGRFHTDWLNMIYPRLRLAKDLLSDDGVVFISIDDNEVENLRKICDEIFGRDNFVGQITVVGNPRGRDYGGIARMHDYLLVYKRSEQAELNLINDTNGEFKMFDSLGGFELRELRNRNIKFNKENRPNLYYPFYINPKEEDEYGLHPISLERVEGWVELYPLESQGVNTVWRWGKPKSLGNLNINIAAKPMKNGGYMIVEKYRESKVMARSVWWDKDTNTEKGTLLVKELLEGKYFDYPKPVEMIMRMLEMGTNSDEQDIVLDFFSGSATTAHAVMQLNLADGGNRKFIMVQLPEMCDEKSEARKAGYKNICEIGKERIRRAGKKIKQEYGEKAENLDIGFRVLKLDDTNMKPVYYTSTQYKQSLLSSLEDNIKEDRTALDLLFQVMLELGKPLSAKIEEKGVSGKKVFIVDDNELIACFDSDVTDEVVKTIAQLKPRHAVFRDSSLCSDSTAANFDQIFATYSPNTIRKVL